MNNAFNPVGKYNALRWASIAVESEIYEYAARSPTLRPLPLRSGVLTGRKARTLR